MKLIIDIPEEEYKEVLEDTYSGTSFENKVFTAIANGTPIPDNAQKPKTGHWIYDDEYSDWFDVTYKCSCCKRAITIPYETRNEVYKDYPYCHCGCKMESEVRNEQIPITP